MMSKEKRRVPKLRFPGFTEDWEQRKLDELTISIGDGLHGTPKYDENGSYYFINGNNLVDSKVSVTEETKKVAFEALSNDDRRLDSTSILMSINGTIGTLARYNNESIMLGKSVAYITPKIINRDFLFYQLQGNVIQSYFYKNLTGTTIKNLGLGTIKNAIVMSTLSEEESKIGQFFYKLDQYITLHQRKLNNLKLKKKALLQKLFPKNEERYPELRFPGFTDAWEQRKFKDIAFKRGKISEADLPYVEFEDINSGIGTLNKNISQKVGHKKGLLFEAGDVLFGKLRPYLQNWLLCQFAGIAVGDFWVLQPQNVSSAFLYYLIQSEAYQSVANISSGTKMPRSSWPLVSETLFSIPKYKEANMIGEFFLLIDRTITLHQRKLDHLQLQKKALLQQMFV